MNFRGLCSYCYIPCSNKVSLYQSSRFCNKDHSRSHARCLHVSWLTAPGAWYQDLNSGSGSAPGRGGSQPGFTNKCASEHEFSLEKSFDSELIQTHRAVDSLLIRCAYGRGSVSQRRAVGARAHLSVASGTEAHDSGLHPALRCACAQDERRGAWVGEGRPLIFRVWAGRKLRGPLHTGHWMLTASSGRGLGTGRRKLELRMSRAPTGSG